MKEWSTLFMGVILLLGLLLTSCRKEEEEIPCQPLDLVANENTTSDMNCLVNGEYWEHYQPFVVSGRIKSSYNITTNEFNLGTTLRVFGNQFGHPCFQDRDTIWQEINVKCFVNKDSQAPLTYRTNSFTELENTCFGNDQIVDYELDTLSPHFIEFVRFDLTNGIVIGKFEFNAINRECPDTVRVRDGRFEVRL